MQKSSIVHCDIKAENVLINRETKQIKFIDFGLCSDKKSKDLGTKMLKGT